MGVYIKGMTYADALRLLAKDKKIIDTRNIIEVKEPHGRLIDADVLCERLLTAWRTADKNGERIISEVMADVVTPIVVGVPTVIESEDE